MASFEGRVGEPTGAAVCVPRDEPAEFVQAIAETSPAMLWMGDEHGRCVFLNGALRRFWGVDPANLEDFDWSSTLHPDDVAMLAGPFAQAMATHTPFLVEARYKRHDGIYRTMRTEANPRFSADGAFLGMTGVNSDITDRLEAEARTRLLMNELNHRTKNILTVVQAVARQTVRHAAPDEFLETFDARLKGLAASNDLLLKNDWTGVQLSELVNAQFAHLSDLLDTRIVATGPPLRVPASGAQTLGMALHELSTNSLKYGALAEPEGRVELSWSGGEATGWQVEWREVTSIAPVPPRRKGFGHTVTVDMVSAVFGAEVTTDFAETGLVWRAVVPPKA